MPSLPAAAGGAASAGPDTCGVRSDSLATTIVIAAARTASPASWPPISRGSSGSADEVWVTPASLWLRVGLLDGVACGVTTGNRLDRLEGVMVAPGIGARFDGASGGPGTGADVGAGPGRLTTDDTDASAGESVAALTVTARLIGAPILAVARTRSVTISSNA